MNASTFLNDSSGFTSSPMTSTESDAWISFSDSCDPSLLNDTTAYETTKSNLVHKILPVMASFALVIETIAVSVLARPGSSRFGSMRQSLITLTATEMWLSSTILVNALWDLKVSSKNENVVELCFSSIIFLSISSAICSRNWIVAVIALARCEAITRPVATRVSTHIFSPRRQQIYFTLLILIGIILSTLRVATRQMVICTNLQNIVNFSRSGSFFEANQIIEKVFFAYQSAIPITIVTIATLFMSIALLRHRMPSVKRQKSGSQKKGDLNEDESNSPWNCCRIQRKKLGESKKLQKDEDGCGSVIKSIQTVRQAQRLPNQIRATKFITIIAILFILCEAPVFFAVIFRPQQIVFVYLRLLIILDSFANFCIYLLNSKPFRNELINLCCCRKTQYRNVSTISQPRFSRSSTTRL